MVYPAKGIVCFHSISIKVSNSVAALPVMGRAAFVSIESSLIY